MAVALDQPFVVVARDKRGDGRPGLVQGLEAVQVQALLLEGADEPLHNPVGQSNQLHTVQSEAFGSPMGARVDILAEGRYLRCPSPQLNDPTRWLDFGGALQKG